ncbi:MAG: amino acid permease, partial [Nostoc sp. CmiVER01]|uniref:amino acid permease n=1 Tax=Nostoc sp. CmiVER01 TaxID=3075384 RepID=UPI003D16213D
LIRAAGTLGMMTVIYACLNASSRTIFALARDGHLPGSLTTVNPRTHSPDACVWLIAGFAALAATLTPVMQLAQLINVGTLGAFSCVALAALRPGPSGQRPFAMRIVAITSLLCTSALLTLLLYHVWRGALIFIGAASLIFGLRWIRRTAAVTP